MLQESFLSSLLQGWRPAAVLCIFKFKRKVGVQWQTVQRNSQPVYTVHACCVVERPSMYQWIARRGTHGNHFLILLYYILLFCGLLMLCTMLTLSSGFIVRLEYVCVCVYRLNETITVPVFLLKKPIISVITEHINYNNLHILGVCVNLALTNDLLKLKVKMGIPKLSTNSGINLIGCLILELTMCEVRMVLIVGIFHYSSTFHRNSCLIRHNK